MKNKAAARETRPRHQKQSRSTKNKTVATRHQKQGRSNMAPKTRPRQHGTKNKATATQHQKQGRSNTTQTAMPQQHHPNCHAVATKPTPCCNNNPHQPHTATIPTNPMPCTPTPTLWQHHPKAPRHGNTTQTTTPWKPLPPPHCDNNHPHAAETPSQPHAAETQPSTTMLWQDHHQPHAVARPPTTLRKNDASNRNIRNKR